MSEITVEYCEQRVQEEKRAASRASCPEAKHAHQQLAHEFEKKADGLRARAERLGTNPSQFLFS